MRRLRVFIILHTTTEVLMISMMKTRELKFLSSLYLFRKSVPVNVSLSQVAKDKAPVTHEAPTLPAGLPCLLWPRVPHPAGTGDPTWPSSPCQPPNVAHCFAHLTPGCLLPVLLICTRQVSYQMEHNPKTRVVAMRLVGNNRKFI